MEKPSNKNSNRKGFKFETAKEKFSNMNCSLKFLEYKNCTGKGFKTENCYGKAFKPETPMKKLDN